MSATTFRFRYETANALEVATAIQDSREGRISAYDVPLLKIAMTVTRDDGDARVYEFISPFQPRLT